MNPQETFTDKLRRAQEATSSLLCVGLDPDPARLPQHPGQPADLTDRILAFCLNIVDATSDVTCAYKLNFAFFEALGAGGWSVLERLSAAIPESKIKIADAKRGDIGNTGRFYAEAILERMAFDACTVSPYMGRSSVEPFLQYRGKAAFVLARTSNPDAAEIQEWRGDGSPLYRHVAHRAMEWGAGQPGEVGLVVGATDAESMAVLRHDCPETTFLIPGVGAQGGELSRVLASGLTDRGRLLINSSRSILYAGSGPDFLLEAAAAARSLRDDINRFRDR